MTSKTSEGMAGILHVASNVSQCNCVVWSRRFTYGLVMKDVVTASNQKGGGGGGGACCLPRTFPKTEFTGKERNLLLMASFCLNFLGNKRGKKKSVYDIRKSRHNCYVRSRTEKNTRTKICSRCHYCQGLWK